MSSLETSAPLLPPEIIDQILRDRELDEGDLKRCCLVGRAWLAPARKSLYAEVRVRLLNYYRTLGDTPEPEGEELPEHAHLDLKSSRLLDSLFANRSLGRHVEFIWFDWCHGVKCKGGCDGISIRPQEIVLNFAQLCPRVKALDLAQLWLLLSDRQENVRRCWSNLEQLKLDTMTPGTTNTLAQFKHLKTLKANFWEDEVLPRFLTEAFRPLLITELCLRMCDSASWEILQTSTSQFLRKLRVPLKLVSSLRLSQVPHLTRFGIEAYFVAKVDQPQGFLEDLLRTKLLRCFDVNDLACRSLAGDHGTLGRFLPSSCNRVNLEYRFTSVSVLAVTPVSREGHRIQELGLSTNNLEDPFDVRALLEGTGIELIWTD